MGLVLAQVAEVDALRGAAAEREAELQRLRAEMQEVSQRAALAAELAPEADRLRALVRALVGGVLGYACCVVQAALCVLPVCMELHACVVFMQGACQLGHRSSAHPVASAF